MQTTDSWNARVMATQDFLHVSFLLSVAGSRIPALSASNRVYEPIEDFETHFRPLQLIRLTRGSIGFGSEWMLYTVIPQPKVVVSYVADL